MIALRDRRGVASIEFAVAIGVVLTVVFAILDLGRLFAAQHTLNYGVEKAVRYAVVNSDVATAASVAATFRTAATPGLGAGGAAACGVTVSYPQGNAPTLPVTVSRHLQLGPGEQPRRAARLYPDQQPDASDPALIRALLVRC